MLYKKARTLFAFLAIPFLLSSCTSVTFQTGSPVPSQSIPAESSAASPGASGESASKPSVSEADSENSSETGTLDQSSYSESDIEAAKQAAAQYYSGTVFELVSLRLINQTAEGLLFSAEVKKGGVLQDPNRSILLKKSGDIWEVANEGY